MKKASAPTSARAKASANKNASEKVSQMAAQSTPDKRLERFEGYRQELTTALPTMHIGDLSELWSMWRAIRDTEGYVTPLEHFVQSIAEELSIRRHGNGLTPTDVAYYLNEFTDNFNRAIVRGHRFNEEYPGVVNGYSPATEEEAA